jgi:hypothetical protein
MSGLTSALWHIVETDWQIILHQPIYWYEGCGSMSSMGKKCNFPFAAGWYNRQSKTKMPGRSHTQQLPSADVRAVSFSELIAEVWARVCMPRKKSQRENPRCELLEFGLSSRLLQYKTPEWSAWFHPAPVSKEARGMRKLRECDYQRIVHCLRREIK